MQRIEPRRRVGLAEHREALLVEVARLVGRIARARAIAALQVAARRAPAIAAALVEVREELELLVAQRLTSLASSHCAADR